MKKPNSILLTLAVAALAAGCATKEEFGTLIGASTGALLGSTLGRGPAGHAAGMLGGALVGGFIGNRIGASMDAEDRGAQRRPNMGLRTRRTGQWRTPSGHYGYIEPRPIYYYRDMPCREFSQTVFIGGRPETMIGRACRGPDGVWREV